MQTGCKSSLILKHNGSRWKTLVYYNVAMAAATRAWMGNQVTFWVPVITWLFTLPWRQGISQMERFLETLTQRNHPSVPLLIWLPAGARVPPGFRVLREYCAAGNKETIDWPYRSREQTSAHQKTDRGQGRTEAESQIPKWSWLISTSESWLNGISTSDDSLQIVC